MIDAPPQRVRDLIYWTEARLTDARLYYGHGTDNALDEAAWLVGFCIGVEPPDLDGALNRTTSKKEREQVISLVEQRIATRQPLAYLLREAWFAGLRFYVDQRTIVPRSLTAEFIEERFQPWIDVARVRSILDLCCGSGCIGIAAALAFPAAHVDAADISPDALAVTRINIKHHDIGARLRAMQSDLFSALGGRRYNVIVTNPPYVDTADMAALPPEYRHEPALALVAGEQGLDVIARILSEAHVHLEAGGILIAEVGNSRLALEQRFPDIPFLWLMTRCGDESVFALTAEQLARHAAEYPNA